MNGDVGRLHAVLGLDDIFKRAVDAVEDRRIAAEIRREPEFDAVLRLNNFLDDFEIGFDVGAAKSVDRLLGVADHEDFSRDDLHFAPIRRGLAELLGQVKKNFVLDRIGVLKFVDENGAVAAFEIRAHARLIAHQIARANEQPSKDKWPSRIKLSRKAAVKGTSRYRRAPINSPSTRMSPRGARTRSCAWVASSEDQPWVLRLIVFSARSAHSSAAGSICPADLSKPAMTVRAARMSFSFCRSSGWRSIKAAALLASRASQTRSAAESPAPMSCRRSTFSAARDRASVLM